MHCVARRLLFLATIIPLRPRKGALRVSLRDRHSLSTDSAYPSWALTAIRKMARDQDPPAHSQLAGTWRAEKPRRHGASRIRPDVTAAPAVPPPAAPDRAASGIVVGTSMMTAAFTHRYIVSDVDSGHPCVLKPIRHLEPPPPRRKSSTVLRNSSPIYNSIYLQLWTPDAELGRAVSHLHRKWPEYARRSYAAIWRTGRDPRPGK